jgi:hypothetical protein
MISETEIQLMRRKEKTLTGVSNSSKMAQDKSPEITVGPEAEEGVAGSGGVDVSILMRQNFRVPLVRASLSSLFWLVESVEGFCMGIAGGQPSRRTP